MDGDEREFLKAICANPGCDTPRLVYADWLQDRGQDERAEFIRVQIELAGIGSDDVDFQCSAEATSDRPYPDQVHEDGYRCRWCELRARERELWELHGRNSSDWFPIYSLPGFVTVEPVGCEGLSGGNGDIKATPVRGFVERVDLSADYWIEYADAITSANPVTMVVLTTSPRGDDWWEHGAMIFVDGPPGIRHERWPGVTFELLAISSPTTVHPLLPADLELADLALSDAEMDAIGAFLRRRHGAPVPQQS